MFQGCGLFACVSRRGADVRKRGEAGAASSRVAAEPAVWEEEEEAGGAARRMAWAEVESATGAFSSRVIGQGGFSTVYLASLSSARLAAVKVHCSSERLHRAFRQELDVLLSLRHPHIVRLLGYCDERDEGVLVFEYAPNGDLHQRLHGGEEDAVPLPWLRRVAIAFQVATALEYLHEGRSQAVVHGDIKASNVLLDGNMDAKLCDFGFAHSGVSATAGRGRSSGRAIMGSPGYVDPQLLRTGVANEQSDVYSFGVLLLELVTGREAVCRETGRRLTAVVCPTVSEGNVADVVDRSLTGKYSADEAAVVAELAMRCVSDAPGLRPSMADVVHVLQEKTTALISAVGSRLDRRMMF
ncbi:salt tolerance receptor-like cytoplasmic kinase 1 [Triticum urartu]|uniref:salt tolerance receptor-like cytoplasmic kinase 1 n=1 Tax=Triticum urartu TaxID=4572 RepID=UPI002042E72A|nr:salt tolerance receptor-like cytoplasmic kinase 1 [Triticum urartu]